MFKNLSIRASGEIATLRRILRAHEALRDALFPSLPVPAASEPPLVLQLRAAAPNKKDWIIHDHSSAVMRLYAIFEQCIEDLIKEYLTAMPTLFPSYNALPSATITQHRLGVAHILQRLGKEGHYIRLPEADVLSGIAAGNSGRPYSLLPDAFLTDQQNYRADLIIKIFRTLGFDDIWAGAERFTELSAFMLTRDPNESSKGLLKKIVDERNLASHTKMTDTWSASEMQALSTFIEILVRSLCALVERSSVLRQREIGILAEVGKVIHKFSDNIRGVELVATTVSEGDTMIAVDREATSIVQVITLQRHLQPLINYQATNGDQLGIRFDHDLPMGTLLLKDKAPVQMNLAQVAEPAAVERAAPEDRELEEADPTSESET
jgi:hypothetical protein